MESMWRTASEPALVPLLLGTQGCNITFVLDVSDSIDTILGSVKGLLIQTLLRKASLRDSSFNLIQSRIKVNCMSPHMLPCAPHTVYGALSWIHSISCGSDRDLLAALSVASTDPTCDAIHLLCTDPPEQPEVVLSVLPVITAGKPVNMFYLQESSMPLNNKTRNYLQCLTKATGGSCHIIFYDLRGAFGKVIPLNATVTPPSMPSVSPTKCLHCSSTTVSAPHVQQRPSPSLRCSMGNDVFRPHSSCIQWKENLWSPNFFPGCRVLAKRQVDGFYSVGTVIQPVQGCGDVWIVQFDHPPSGSLVAVPSQHQMVRSVDMVNDRRAHAHSLEAGDAVLSPWQQDLRKYGPGRVLAAAEGRDGSSDGRSLQVLMWNTCVSLVPDILVLPISSSHYERIVRELQSFNPAPSPCCRSHCSHTPQMFCNDCCPSGSSSVSNHLTCRSMFERMDGFDGTGNDGLVDFQEEESVKSNPDDLSSSSSLVDETKPSESSESKAVKPRSKQQRPPWRYWRRTGPEPHHKQPGSPASQTPQPVKFIVPISLLSRSPNPSSLFQSLPGAKGRKKSIRNAFGTTNFKPQDALFLITSPQPL